MSHSFTGCCRAASASDANLVLKLVKCRKLLIRKLMKAENREHKAFRQTARLRGSACGLNSNRSRFRRARWRLSAFIHSSYFGYQTTKKAGLSLPQRKQARPESLYDFLEIWGREAAPAETKPETDDDPQARIFRALSNSLVTVRRRYAGRVTDSDRRRARRRPRTGRTAATRPPVRSSSRV